MTRNRIKKPWDDYISERDKLVFEAAGFGTLAGLGKRPALIVIDVNYSFCGEKREPILDSIKKWKLSCGEAAWDAIPVIKKIINLARKKKLPVIYTTGYGRADKWDRGGWSWKNPRKENILDQSDNFSPNRDGNDILDDISPEPQDIVIWKQKPSAFHEAPLASYLQLLQVDTVIILGTTTSGCVRATAIDAFSYNYRVGVVEDACFDRVNISHAASLLDLHSKYADVIKSSEVEQYFNSLASELFDLPGGIRSDLEK
ncbi:MAG: isochorismatase family protein [Pseudomonadota bacterium]|nr:isochorismatase family protein [Pseudomonadota bacterium]